MTVELIQAIGNYIVTPICIVLVVCLYVRGLK